MTLEQSTQPRSSALIADPHLTMLYDKDRIAALQPVSALANRHRSVVYRQLDATFARYSHFGRSGIRFTSKKSDKSEG